MSEDRLAKRIPSSVKVPLTRSDAWIHVAMM
jgi:hypothetical protein